MATRSKAVEQGGKESVTNATRAPARTELESAAGASQGPCVSLLNVQRTRGNRFVQGLLNEAMIQRKCKCNESSAEGEIPDYRHERLSFQRHPDRQTESPVASIVSEVLGATGGPLTAEVRRFMEPRFGRDFSEVRVHTDDRAARSARAVNARAYTVGRHVVFDQGEYKPDSAAGKELVAHELAHVLQQGWGRSLEQPSNAGGNNSLPNASTLQTKLEISQPGDFHEQEADRVAEEVMRMPDPATRAQTGCAGGATGEPDGECPACRSKGFMLQRSVADRPAISVASDACTKVHRGGVHPVTALPQSRQLNGMISPISTAVLQRVPPPPPPPPCSTDVTFSFTDPVHVPPCATTALTARTDGAPIKWSLEPDPTAVDPGTTIAANGRITIGAAQLAGQITARATGASGCFFEKPIRLRSHPTGISNTVMVSVAGATEFGAVFDHTLVSADGNVASLDNVAVGELFIGIPTPTAATHEIPPPLYPFGGTLTFNTATLTPDASNNWFVTPSGELGGSHDSVTIERARINVGLFIQSASNSAPKQGLPVTMTLTQGLHWFCPQAAAASRWRKPAFVTVGHSRTLRSRAGVVEFVTTVNGLEVVQTYDGAVGVFNATASPVNTPRSAAGAAAPKTVRITVDTLPTALPAGQNLLFSIIGNARGCAVAADPNDNHAAILTIGTSSGTVVVEVADSTNQNRARVSVTITE